MYIILTKTGPVFFADCTVNKNPTAEELVEITLQTCRAVKEFKVTPRVALLSYSNFGSSEGEGPSKMRQAVDFLHANHPELIVDGEIQVNAALNADLLSEIFPFSKLNGGAANTFIFPNLDAGNISYKLMQEMAHFQVIGPVLNGLNKSVHVLQMGSGVSEIVNMIMISVLGAQCQQEKEYKNG